MSATNVTLNVTNETSTDNTPVKNYQDFLKTDILKYACEKIAEKTTDGKLIITHSNEPQSNLITNLALDSLHIFCKLMQMKTTKLNGPAIAGIADNVRNDLLKNPAKLNELKQFLVRKKICLLFEKSILGDESLEKIKIDPPLNKTLDGFLKSNNRLLVVHGFAGCGKTVSLRLYLKSFLGKMNWTPIYFHLEKEDVEFKTLSEMKNFYLVDDTQSDKVGSFLIVVDGYDELTDWGKIDTHLNCKEWPNSKFIVLFRSFVINTDDKDYSNFVIEDKLPGITCIEPSQTEKSYIQLEKLVEERIEDDWNRKPSLRKDIQRDVYSNYAFKMFMNGIESIKIEENTSEIQNHFCSLGLFTRDWSKKPELWIRFIDTSLIHYFVTKKFYKSLAENELSLQDVKMQKICKNTELKRLLVERCQNDFRSVQVQLRHTLMLKIQSANEEEQKDLICYTLNIWAEAFFLYLDNKSLNEETEPYAFSLYQTVFVAYRYGIPFSEELCEQLYLLGKKYLDEGDHFDVKNAQQLFTISGSNGNRSASEKLGNMYRDGVIDKQVNTKEALKWYDKFGNKDIDDNTRNLINCMGTQTVKTIIDIQEKLESNVVILGNTKLSDSVQDNHIEQVAAKFPELRQLSLSECTNITNLGLASFYIHPLKYLIQLDIAKCKHVNDDGIKVVNILTSLRKLTLTGCNITKIGLDIVFKHKQLTNLAIRGMEKLKINDFENVSNLRNLRLLNIHGCTSLRSLDSFTKLTKLRTLCIGSMNCGEMLNTLPKFKSLSELYIWKEKMDVSNLKRISSMDQLKTLQLVECNGSSSGIECLAQLTSLRTLILVELEKLNNDHFAKFTSLHQLRVLGLEKCEYLTDKSLILISNFTNLQDLRISNNNYFTKNGIKNLHSLKTLERMKLEDCAKIKDYKVPAIKAFKNALPELDVKL